MILMENISKSNDYTSILSAVAIFSSLNSDELAIVSRCCAVTELNPGSVLFHAGEKCSQIKIVITGSINIMVEEDHADDSILAQLVKGDSFGELELLTGVPFNAKAVAEKTEEGSKDGCSLLSFPSENAIEPFTFENFCMANPGIAAKMLFAYLKSTSGRLRNALSIIKENSPLMQELKKQVYGDKLTGLFNKTYLEEKIPEYIKNNPSEKLALIMFKPDNFKEINDTFGHESGDQVIVLMAGELGKRLSDHDQSGLGIAVKYMGNELALLLPGIGREEAKAEAEKIKHYMNNLNISDIIKNDSFKITVSSGISIYPDHSDKCLELIAIAHELPLIGRGRGGSQILFPEDK
jgi:diguanylate cyclase (GGDEF)-like protein